MRSVQIGTRVKPLGIQRLSVGEGQKCRAVLIDPNPQMKYVAYDENVKRRVEVDQDMVIKYGLRASATFYYLVAKLNTDLNGNVIGDQFVVEYLQLSENLNNEFSENLMEQGGVVKSLSLKYVKKTGANGRDFSYIKPTVSAWEPEGSLADKINQLRSNPDFISKCWMMVDADTSITKEAYEKLLAGGTTPQQPARQIPPAQAARPALSASQPTSSPMPQVPDNFAEVNDFGGGDDFDNWN